MDNVNWRFSDRFRSHWIKAKFYKEKPEDNDVKRLKNVRFCLNTSYVFSLRTGCGFDNKERGRRISVREKGNYDGRCLLSLRGECVKIAPDEKNRNSRFSGGFVFVEPVFICRAADFIFSGGNPDKGRLSKARGRHVLFVRRCGDPL